MSSSTKQPKATDTNDSEAELCLKLEQYYSDWEVYKEVPTWGGGRCDMYVKKECLWISIEVKKQFSTTLIYQALRNVPYANYSYVAVPDLKNDSAARAICAELGIGVLVLRKHSTGFEEWQELVKPVFRRRITPFRVLDRMKDAVAGIQHNSESEFKITINVIILWIKRNGGRLSVKKCFETNKYHYSHSRSASQAITRLCKLGKIKEFRFENGDFVLNENK